MGEETNYGGRQQQEDLIKELNKMHDTAIKQGHYENANSYLKLIANANNRINNIDTKNLESAKQISNTIIESGKEVLKDVVAVKDKSFWDGSLVQMGNEFNRGRNTLGGLMGGGITGAAGGGITGGATGGGLTGGATGGGLMGGAKGGGLMGGGLMGGGVTGAANLGSVVVGGLISVASIVALRSLKSHAAENPKPHPRMPEYFKYLGDWVIYAGTQIKNNGGNMKNIRKVKTFQEWLKNSAL